MVRDEDKTFIKTALAEREILKDKLNALKDILVSYGHVDITSHKLNAVNKLMANLKQVVALKQKK